MLVSWKNGCKKESKTGSRTWHIKKKENKVHLNSSINRHKYSMKRP